VPRRGRPDGQDTDLIKAVREADIGADQLSDAQMTQPFTGTRRVVGQRL
jgi:hypothetical protein